ncbi:unnamed protein product, partial [marine sediment metagenome]
DNQKYGCATLIALCVTRGLVELIMVTFNL